VVSVLKNSCDEKKIKTILGKISGIFMQSSVFDKIDYVYLLTYIRGFQTLLFKGHIKYQHFLVGQKYT